MRRRLIWIGLMACAASACGDDDADTPITVASGTVEPGSTPEVVAAASADPEHGGTVVVAGRYRT